MDPLSTPAPHFDANAVSQKRFPLVANGFDPDEVLLFLNELAVTLLEHEQLRDDIERARVHAQQLLAQAQAAMAQAMHQQQPAHQPPLPQGDMPHAA